LAFDREFVSAIATAGGSPPGASEAPWPAAGALPSPATKPSPRQQRDSQALRAGEHHSFALQPAVRSCQLLSEKLVLCYQPHDSTEHCARVSGGGHWRRIIEKVAGTALAVLTNRYEFLVMSYAATAARLTDLLDEWRIAGMPTDSVQWSKFVPECENAISVENESWLAKWAESGSGGG
jgi:hypothetical protein